VSEVETTLRPPRPEDREAIERITRSSGFFSPEEVKIALEVFDEAVTSPAAGYVFLVAEVTESVRGYACWGGPAEQTESTFELYWIAVEQGERNRGIGRRLLHAAEEQAVAAGASLLVAETAGRAQYAPTHLFYERAGYRRVAEVPDFYAPGDAKVFFVKAF